MPHRIALQLVEAARQMADRPVELTLEPEELGRVRMTLTTGDGAMTVGLTTERAETADLLRRHIETLAQEFRQLGYRDVTFEFAGGRGGNGATPERDAPGHNDAAATESETPTEDGAEAPARLHLSDRMDLRL
ncbi:flagellar hook-length control protein FliK [Psychromarinibacter sp. C21-152]|uniref:Flagellar hook-length control protein FliK n=2 Tax=Psychromarinibacter sediminicola TaxID=3033385 RepID=A0AAE3NT41_9RHOB|nr:flagellar hook-length control protein FliK [Psychromarinibacter sediminicola]